MAEEKQKIKRVPIEKLLAEHFKGSIFKNNRIYKVTDKTNGSNGIDYMIITNDGFEIYLASKKVENNEEVLENVRLIKSLSWSDFQSVKVDKFALTTLYDFDNGFKLQVDSNDLIKHLQENGINTILLERKWYNKILGFRSKKKWKMVFASIVYLLILFAAVDGFTESDAEKAETAAAEEKKAEEQSKNKTEKEVAAKKKATKEQNEQEASSEDSEEVEASTNEKIGTLGYTTEEFKEKWNTVNSQLGSTFPLDNLEVEEGPKQDTFKLLFSKQSAIIGTVNKNEQSVRDVVLVLQGDGTARTATDNLLLMGQLIATTNPSLSPEERAQVLEDLGFKGENIDINKLDGIVEKNGVRYHLQGSDQIGIMLSAGDPNDN